MEYLISIVKKVSLAHKHDRYEIIICTQGNGIFHTNDAEFKVSPGMFIIIPPGIEHTGSAIDAQYERIYIQGSFQHVFQLTEPAVVTDNPSGEGMQLAKMIYNNRFANREYVTALVSAFSHFLQDRINVEDEIFRAIQEILEEITENFHDSSIDLCALLRRSGYSEDYIRARFKRVTGKTPTEFLTKTRISHACYLIDVYRNSVPLTAVSEQCGYTDYVYFSRKFKQLMGISPREYKKKVMYI